jgi:hypothetical protein
MANTSSRGGKKTTSGKHQGVRKGSTGTRKERQQTEKRHPAFDERRERTTARREKRTETLANDRQPAKRRKGPAAKKVRSESPDKRGQVKAGTGRKNLYANMPKARKVR